jgi:integrase
MSVRKRTWTTRSGERREAWIVDYSDQRGKRHIETFDRKKDADAKHATVKVDVQKGIHTAPSRSITIAEAAADWIRHAKLENREAATVVGYKQLVANHIAPRIGKLKLAHLSTPRIQAFRDELLHDLSRDLARKVLVSVKAILKEARRRGNVAQNVAADVSIRMDARNRTRLEIGRDIPSRDEIKRILAAAPEGRGRALLLTAAFTGLRASELRGLRWEDVDLANAVLRVRQRADRYNTIGRPKSASGERELPIGPMVVNTLRTWKLACPAGGLVFPTGIGTVEGLNNIVRRMFNPVQIAAGVVDKDGRAKYGMHAMRHFYASWCINRRQDGGLELPPKSVQARLGHASIVITLDRYGHLFPSHDDGAELAAAERALLT